MSRLRLLSLVAPLAIALTVVLTVGAPALAVDPPHWESASFQITCTLQCHTLHGAPGSSLTSSASNVNLCQSCHNPSGLASALAMNDTDKAVPGVGGTSHSFDAVAVNAGLGAQLPLATAMAQRVMNGKVVCSTCHDQHDGSPLHGGTVRISPASRLTALGSTGTAASGGTFTGTAGFWYLLEIAGAGTQATARFGYSKDNGATWFPAGCDPPAAAVTGCLTASASPVALADGITVAFGTGSLSLHERWQFSASWPFLRANLDSGDNATGDRFCRDCHRDWVMTHGDVRTYTGTFRSHPVGIALGANGLGYDRATPLDGNGAVQGSVGADTDPTNDYRLDAGGRVQCLSCHGIHHADSNSATVDAP